jgi:hypothetical protein
MRRLELDLAEVSRARASLQGQLEDAQMQVNPQPPPLCCDVE